jgi:signal transduction histidine kinase
LSQIFLNLIGNALKYHGTEPPRIRISACVEGGEWKCSVSDQGIGIDPQYHERIFGAFERGESGGREGLGLGLALVTRVLERRGGRIWVDSEPGKGATFWFVIPARF